MPAPLSTSLLVLATLLCVFVTPWAGIPVAVIAVLNELVRVAVLATAASADGPPSFDDK